MDICQVDFRLSNMFTVLKTAIFIMWLSIQLLVSMQKYADDVIITAASHWIQ